MHTPASRQNPASRPATLGARSKHGWRSFSLTFVAVLGLQLASGLTQSAGEKDQMNEIWDIMTSPDNPASKEHGNKPGRGRNKQNRDIPMPEGEWPVASLLVARPGATTMDINVLASTDLSGRIEYGEKGGTKSLNTICMGDDFSADKLRETTAAELAKVYLSHRHYLGLIGHSAPLFLVNGNHEQAARCNLDGTPNNVAVWAQNSREKYFSQPVPEGIFTGNPEPVEHIGLLRNYFAWTWGDALFVVIDPYWHSSAPVDNAYGENKKDRPEDGKSEGKNKRDLWKIGLGDKQYAWLKETLSKSKAPFKFVFAHHVNGTGRGGVEQAAYYEWGGKSRNGSDDFAAQRPGWDLPIHQLMAKYGVTIFFQGHDHIFCKQSLDGVIYQTLPDPANTDYTVPRNEKAYKIGDAVANSGRIRVSVSPENVKVDYIRSYLPKDATPEHPDGEISYSYTIPSKNKK